MDASPLEAAQARGASPGCQHMRPTLALSNPPGTQPAQSVTSSLADAAKTLPLVGVGIALAGRVRLPNDFLWDVTSAAPTDLVGARLRATPCADRPRPLVEGGAPDT
jgi:hypothetical protein